MSTPAGCLVVLSGYRHHGKILEWLALWWSMPSGPMSVVGLTWHSHMCLAAHPLTCAMLDSLHKTSGFVRASTYIPVSMSS